VNEAVQILLVVVLPVLLAVGGLLLVQRLVPPRLRREHNDVAGFIYAVVGVIYAVLLAFVVIVVWQQLEATRNAAEDEANELAGIYFLANSFSDPEQSRVQDLARSYGRTVVEEEWPLMAQGKASPRAWALLDELRLAVQAMDPRTEAQQVLYDQGLTRVHELSDARRIRLLDAKEGIPPVLWAALVAGGVITVSFTYLFGLKSNWAHALMVASLALVVTVMLFTIVSLDYPFAGAAQIPPDAFESVLHRFEANS
jgi:hypothetical protein